MRRACSRDYGLGPDIPSWKSLRPTDFRHQYSTAVTGGSLRVTYGGMFQGGMIDSPLAYLMNTAFYLQGTHFLVGAVLVARLLKARRRDCFSPSRPRMRRETFWLAPSTADHHEDRWHGNLHGAGTVLAIVGGNMAILVGTAIARAASRGLVLRLLSL